MNRYHRLRTIISFVSGLILTLSGLRYDRRVIAFLFESLQYVESHSESFVRFGTVRLLNQCGEMCATTLGLLLSELQCTEQDVYCK